MNSVKTFLTPYGKISYFYNDFYFVREASVGRIHEQNVWLGELKKYVSSSHFVIDAGAHAGSFTVLAKHINPSLQIHCFEPQTNIFELLELNVKQNSLTGVHAHNVALSNIDGEVYMDSSFADVTDEMIRHASDADMDNIGLFNFGAVGITHDLNNSNLNITKMITLDSFNFSSCDLLKIDVEGSEPAVLLGAKKLIQTHKPVIVFEDNGRTLNGKTAKHLSINNTAKEILVSFGYSIMDVTAEGYAHDLRLAIPESRIGIQHDK
jgi:FkbM family methyltransferase